MEYQFFNRELSWVEFNARVLNEACKKDLPLFERLRFLGIVSSNFDEFFMVRIASLKRQALSQNPNSLKFLSIQQELNAISNRIHQIIQKQYAFFQNDIILQLKNEGIEYLKPQNYSKSQRDFLQNYFLEKIFPLLTPLSFKKKNFSSILPLCTNVAFLLKPQNENLNAFDNEKNENLLFFVQIPNNLKQIIWLPNKNENIENIAPAPNATIFQNEKFENGKFEKLKSPPAPNALNFQNSQNNKKTFTLIEDLVQTFGHFLFSHLLIEESLVFKITRDADFAIDEKIDFVKAMEEVLEKRQNSFLVNILCSDTSQKIVQIFKQTFQLSKNDIYKVSGPIDLQSFYFLNSLLGFENLKSPIWKAKNVIEFENENIWRLLQKKDKLLHFPYESFDAVLHFLRLAASDKKVLAIKITLYRTSKDSKIVEILEKAAKNGKQVTVFIELKARFDEKRNINWAKRLKNAGAIVICGIKNFKVHAKLLLIIRNESDALKRYVHISTGNYNDKTAKFYCDFALFSANEKITKDATTFFNMLSAHFSLQPMNCLFVSPFNLKQKLIELIEREESFAKRGKKALIMAKMNSIAHEEIIKCLYKASCSGAKILLNVRGICRLVPGVKNLSENIKVQSIIDRYLEHGRIFYFFNGGNEEIYLSSADWMPRNLEKRVEIMVPIFDSELKERLKTALNLYFKDNSKSYTLLENGTWQENIENIEACGTIKSSSDFENVEDVENSKSSGETKIRSQEEFYKMYESVYGKGK